MTEEKTKLTITQENDGGIKIQGDEAAVKKAAIAIGELFLKEDEMTEERLDTLVEIAEELWNAGKCSPEHFSTAKRFLEVAEKYSHPRATNVLSCLQTNPLISNAMNFRGATRGDDPCIDFIQENYKIQAELWRKKIAAAEGKPFEGEVPTKEDILNADRIRFFEIYERAFNGELEAMQVCLEFCEEEVAYWNSR